MWGKGKKSKPVLQCTQGQQNGTTKLRPYSHMNKLYHQCHLKFFLGIKELDLGSRLISYKINS